MLRLRRLVARLCNVVRFLHRCGLRVELPVLYCGLVDALCILIILVSAVLVVLYGLFLCGLFAICFDFLIYALSLFLCGNALLLLFTFKLFPLTFHLELLGVLRGVG